MWDIYGEKLLPGHCEVHPWVHCEYPCPVCLSENEKSNQDKIAEQEYWEGARIHYEKLELEQFHYELLEHGVLLGGA